MLVRLIYTSKLDSNTTVGDLNAILDASRKNNPKLRITGVLFYTTKYYLQWLEGPRKEVNKLYNMVAEDKRHSDVTILDYADVQKREFGSWAMAFVSSQGVDRKIWRRFVSTDEVDPYRLTQENAADFLRAAAKAQESILGGRAEST
ncbi:BLUF domain-containing protein [bacterium]|nr:BLUF domain-containing protein [bacterium]